MSWVVGLLESVDDFTDFYLACDAMYMTDSKPQLPLFPKTPLHDELEEEVE